jgi:hypothetical protein
VSSGYHGGPRPVSLPAQTCSVADGLDSRDGCAADHRLHWASRTSPWSPCVTTRRGIRPLGGRCSPRGGDHGGRAVARYRAARSPHYRPGPPALPLAAGARLPEGVGRRLLLNNRDRVPMLPCLCASCGYAGVAHEANGEPFPTVESEAIVLIASQHFHSAGAGGDNRRSV